MNYDPYCYPGTSVLRNLFGIEEEEGLRAAEARVAALALLVFENEPLARPMDEQRLRYTHAAIFGEIYDWAGTYRSNTGTMTKGRSLGYSVTYGDSRFVATEMNRIFAELTKENYLQGLNSSDFAERLTYFYGEFDATHPFREGNSRTLRKFTADVSLAAGFELDWEPTGLDAASRNALYIARDLAFTQGDRSKLKAIIAKNLRTLQP